MARKATDLISRAARADVVGGVLQLSGGPGQAAQNTAFSFAPTRFGGTGPYTYAISVGALPAGLSLNTSTGVISGTPTAVGTTTATLRVTDSLGAVATLPMTFVVSAAAAVLALSGTPGAAVQGTAYSFAPTRTGGTGPFGFTIVSGSLIAGLSLNTSTGVVSGTPTGTGTNPATIRVTDSLGATADLAISITTSAAAAGLTLASLSRPALALAYFYNLIGDSMTFGNGTLVGYDYPQQLRGSITTDVVSGFHFGAVGGNAGTAIHKVGNGGQSGQNSTTLANAIVSNLTAYPSENARTTILMVGVNDYNAGVTGWARDWPAQVKTNSVNGAAALTGGAVLWSFLTPAENGASNGIRYGADHRFHFHDMVATRGSKVVDVLRYLRFARRLEGIAAGSADDWAVNVMGIMPYKYRGGSTSSLFSHADVAAVPSGTGSAPTDLTPVEGTIGYSTTGTTYRKLGSSGTGSWETVDTKHFSAQGYAVIKSLAGDVLAATEGIGPPFVPPARMKIAQDAPAGTAVGQLLPTGAVTGYALRDYADQPITAFAVDASGNISRTAAGTLSEGVTGMVVVAANANGALLSPLDIYVGRPSTVTMPRMKTISAPGFAIAGRDAHGMADGQRISGATWFTTPPAGTQAYYTNLTRTAAPLNSFLMFVNTSGNMVFRAWDNTNTQILNGSFAVAPNTTYWLTWAFDFSSNTKCAYLNEVAPTFTPTLTAGTIPLSDSNPLFLAFTASKEFLAATYPHIGPMGFHLFTDGYIDWTNAANRRLLFNTDGTAAVRTPYAAIGGVTPRFETWFDFGNLAWGSPDMSYGPKLLSASHQAFAATTAFGAALLA